MEAIAKAKYIKGSPQKARLVIDLVRGKNVSKALAILQYTNKRAAGPIAKCIRSAIANATYKAEQENIAIDPDDLWIKSCFVDMGPTKNRRRLRPAPQGRAYFERRHFCHITVELTSEVLEEEPEAPVKKSIGTKKKAEAKPETKKAEKKAEEVAEEKVEEKEARVETPVVEKEKAETQPEEPKAEANTEEKAEEKVEEKETTEEPTETESAEEEVKDTDEETKESAETANEEDKTE